MSEESSLNGYRILWQLSSLQFSAQKIHVENELQSTFYKRAHPGVNLTQNAVVKLI